MNCSGCGSTLGMVESFICLKHGAGTTDCPVGCSSMALDPPYVACRACRTPFTFDGETSEARLRSQRDGMLRELARFAAAGIRFKGWPQSIAAQAHQIDMEPPLHDDEWRRAVTSALDEFDHGVSVVPPGLTEEESLMEHAAFAVQLRRDYGFELAFRGPWSPEDVATALAAAGDARARIEARRSPVSHPPAPVGESQRADPSGQPLSVAHTGLRAAGPRTSGSSPAMATAEGASATHPSLAALKPLELLDAKTRQLAVRNIGPDEPVLFCIRGLAKQAIVGLPTRVMVIKRGYMAGAAFGSKVTSLSYLQLTGAEVRMSWSAGFVELLAPSYQGKPQTRVYTGSSDQNCYHAPNCLPISRAMLGKAGFQEALQFLRASITVAR
jgi:hypothetical protein